jgi:hypothetical protein
MKFAVALAIAAGLTATHYTRTIKSRNDLGLLE